MSSNDDDDWIETVVRLATSLGFNGMRVRWKLIGLQKSWQRTARRTELETAHLRYEHAVCPHCGRVQDRSEKKCVGCGQSMAPRPWQLVQRLGFVVPNVGSVSTLLGILILGAYFRVMIARSGGGYFGVDTDLLIRFGGYWLPAIKAGEFWRLSTAIFLHIGLWHLGFNMVALAQIGPAIEEVFGRGRMLFFFMLTGIASFAACQLLGMQAPSAGASGAIMGLIGLAAGWGQSDGTGQGRAVRNQMLKWGAYTMAFGFFVGANHIAHGAGFLVGAVLGYTTPASWIRRDAVRPLDVLFGVLGLATACATLALIVRPPPGSDAHMPRREAIVEQYDPEEDFDASAYFGLLSEACPMHEAGRDADALDRLRKGLPKVTYTDPLDVPQVEQLCVGYRNLFAYCNSPRDPGAPGERIVGDGIFFGAPSLRNRQAERSKPDFCAMIPKPVQPALRSDAADGSFD
ncbi:MAG: rhomboid family intramembrane serine protease [Deltaproteobacteria bacterium]|nr:rhomboid family intramembrane serine protease [Deltaproteobacteria bacterium]